MAGVLLHLPACFAIERQLNRIGKVINALFGGEKTSRLSIARFLWCWRTERFGTEARKSVYA